MSYIGVQPTAGQYRKLDNISSGFNGSTTSFTTSVSGTNVTAGTAQQLLVSLGGVIQQPDTDYTVSTNTITFTTAPTSGLSFFAVLMGDALNTVSTSDGAITTAKLAGNLSVGLADGTVSAPSLYFTADTNTGLYRIGANQLGLTTDGTVALTVDASQRVGIGTTAPSQLLEIKGANARFAVNSTTVADGGILLQGNGTTYAEIKLDASSGILDIAEKQAAGNITFSTGTAPTERARIDSSGTLLVGTSSASATALLQVQGNQSNSGGSGGLQLRRGEAATSITSGESIGYITFSDNAGGPFGSIECVSDAAAGTNDYPGRLVFSTTADGASSPTERMRITNAGDILAAKTSTGLSVVGHEFFATGTAYHTTDTTGCLALNRQGNDGTLVDFRQANTTEGSISVSGTTVSYNGAHLSRWSQLPSGAERTEILRGSVLSNIDEMCEWGDEENEQLNRMKVSDVEGDKNVSGVFQAWDDDDDTYTNDFYCAMTGDFIIRIGADVTVERGDLLMSAGDGTAKPQDDDIIRSKTIAKVTSTNVSCTYDDGSYCVPCVLMAC